MAYSAVPARSTADANASADINQLQDNIDAIIESGAGAPASTPTIEGLKYIDTTGNRVYIATGTASSADWEKQAKYEYGVITVTGGGGDITITLDWDWSDGALIIVRSPVGDANKYFDDTNGATYIITTYDALTNAGYTSDQTISINTTPGVSSLDKTTNSSGWPKSATTVTFVLDDDGANTRYMKWWVIA